MLTAVEFTHLMLRARLRSGDGAIDATAGNGHDTLVLAQLVGNKGCVFAFDVQKEALQATGERLDEAGIPARCRQLLHLGHEAMTDAIPAEWHGKIGAVIFNLGYLPGGDKSVMTTAAATLSALRQALALLRPGGMTAVVYYAGHPGGAEEAAAVRDFARRLPVREFHVTGFSALNVRNPAPGVIVIEKRGESRGDDATVEPEGASGDLTDRDPRGSP